MNSLDNIKNIFVSFKAAVKKAARAVYAFLYRLVCDIIPSFLKNNIEISSVKGWRIAGVALGAVLTLAVVIDIGAYTRYDGAGKWWLMAAALSLPWITAFFAAFDFKISKDKAATVWHFILLVIMPFAGITMTECLNDRFIYDMTYLGLLANYVVFLVLYCLVYGLSGSLKISFVSVNAVLFGFALAHSYIMNFRGTPFLPMDFFSITTAAGVANTYSYIPTYKEMTGILLFVLVTVIGLKAQTPRHKTLAKIIGRSITTTFAVTVIVLFYFTDIFTGMGVTPDFWNQTRGYRNYGFVYNFFSNMNYLKMDEPSGYNPDDVGEFVSSTVQSGEPEENKKPPAQVSETSPNIICIMNESLADLSVLGEFETNIDYMPFMRGLKKNTVKGNLYVPVIGAGTSNSEFEFLTGHSTAFLPSGSNAYMLYLKNPIASLVSTLEGQGYSSYSFHPYYAAGWNRTTVYKNLGFDRFVSLENIMDIGLMDEFKNAGNDGDYLQSLVEQAYPKHADNMLLRQYISDSFDYQELIKDYEKHDSKVPYFAFNVTMQNHGGYTGTFANFEQEVYTTSTSEQYTKVNNYLSLVKKSDDAFRELIKYFGKVEEPTIICMFGDHQPTVEPEFIAEILGVDDLSRLTPEQEQLRHVTPFYIWANYDIEEKKIERLSANYLSSLVLDIAGVELTEYNKYLLNLAQTLPVIDTVGYIDAQGNYFRWSDSSPYNSILDEYEKVQYNNIFDQDNKNIGIFYLEDYEYVEPEAYSEELYNKPKPYETQGALADEIADIVTDEGKNKAAQDTARQVQE